MGVSVYQCIHIHTHIYIYIYIHLFFEILYNKLLYKLVFLYLPTLCVHFCPYMFGPFRRLILFSILKLYFLKYVLSRAFSVYKYNAWTCMETSSVYPMFAKLIMGCTHRGSRAGCAACRPPRTRQGRWRTCRTGHLHRAQRGHNKYEAWNRR